MATSERLMDEFRGMAGRSFDAAEATIEHAADSTLEVIRFSDQASAGLKQGLLELQLKALEIAEFNAQACLGYWRNVFGFGAPSSLGDIHSDFIASHLGSLWRQSCELADLTMRLATAIPPAQPGLKSPCLSE
jgi:hypothetical protein